MEANCNIIPTLITVIPWLLVIAGWWQATQRIDRITTRREVRDSIDLLSNFLDGLEEEAIKYHASSKPNPELAAQIKRKLN